MTARMHIDNLLSILFSTQFQFSRLEIVIS